MGDADNVEEDDHETHGDMKWEHAVVQAAEWLNDAGLEEEEGVDRVIEASGAEDCGLYGVAIAKQGAICESYLTLLCLCKGPVDILQTLPSASATESRTSSPRSP